ncbi:MAG: hypothetical protein MMC33_005348 [Icmadophila ericetorum]|nr:hypothetical protein [Icmadophila ericetorum]
MALVDYSDSEASEDESPPAAPALSQKITGNTTKPTTKPAFQKVVDPSKPHKIKISLPEIQKTGKEDEEADEPPAKKPKIGPGSFSGFNSFLPAPKRSAATNGGSGGSGLKRGGLGSGVSLKTGAAPGFSREAMPTHEEDTEMPEASSKIEIENAQSTNASTAEAKLDSEAQGTSEKSKIEPKKSAMMFMPLSVARKPQKKKAVAAPKPAEAVPAGMNTEPVPEAKKIAKPSLFSLPTTDESSVVLPSTAGEYKPMMYSANSTSTEQDYISTIDDSNVDDQDPSYSSSTAQSQYQNGPQSLDAIASDLNLSKSARRQLMGRNASKGENTSAINVLNFNTDEEYASNELLRQAGETVKVNPVRAIAAGKHSLRQLINAASSQKEALEEHFASGKRNKKEAGSKYGW